MSDYRTKLSDVRMKSEALARAGWRTTKRGWAWTCAAARDLLAALKRVTILILVVLERVLLSRRGRERVHATAVFTLIFAFLVSSVDFLIAGGPDFGPAQRVGPSVVQVDLVRATSLPQAAVAAAADEETPVTRMNEPEGVVTPVVSLPRTALSPSAVAQETREPPQLIGGPTASARGPSKVKPTLS